MATLQYIYRDATGAPLLIANRYEPKGKFFLLYDLTRQDWKAPAIRPLYNLDMITVAEPETPVWFVEGEKCADALTGLGFLATTSFGGCNALAKSDLSPLKGRKVLIWPDYDEPGQNYAKSLEIALVECGTSSVISLEITEATLATICANQCEFALMRGWDAADAVASGWTPDMVKKLQIVPNSEDEISANMHKYVQISLISGTARNAKPLHLSLWKIISRIGLSTPTHSETCSAISTIAPRAKC